MVESRSINDGPIRRSFDKVGSQVDDLGEAIDEMGYGPNTDWVYYPAYAGPRSDNSNNAHFGNHNAQGFEGITVGSVGDVDAVVRSGRVFGLWQNNGGGSYVNFGSLKLGWSMLNGMGIGAHPGYGAAWAPALWSEWGRNNVNGNDYTIITGATTGNAGQTLINGWNLLRLHVASLGIVSLDAQNVTMHRNTTVEKQLRVQGYAPANLQWDTAHLLLRDDSSNARLCLYKPGGYAPQLRSHTDDVGAMSVVDSTMADFAPIKAKAFTVSSSQTLKRHIRPLREAEPRPASAEPLADVVEIPDVMALQPVAFRSLHPLRRIVATGPGPVDTDDPTTWTFEDEPLDTVAGHESHRERLGLIAEDVQHVVPSAVSHNAEGAASGIDYAQITVALLDHVQELTRTVETLRYRITELEAP